MCSSWEVYGPCVSAGGHLCSGFSQGFAEHRTGHVEMFAGAVRKERSKELALSLEKEEEGGS